MALGLDVARGLVCGAELLLAFRVSPDLRECQEVLGGTPK